MTIKYVRIQPPTLIATPADIAGWEAHREEIGESSDISTNEGSHAWSTFWFERDYKQFEVTPPNERV